MSRATPEDRIERLEDAFRAFGYVVTAEPEMGSEDIFEDALHSALLKVERTFSANSKRYGYRGRSRNALAALHTSIPYPCFGVKAEGK